MDQKTSRAQSFVFQRWKLLLDVNRLCKMTAGDPMKTADDLDFHDTFFKN